MPLGEVRYSMGPTGARLAQGASGAGSSEAKQTEVSRCSFRVGGGRARARGSKREQRTYMLCAVDRFRQGPWVCQA
jgi:hypothetical protein